MKSAWVVVVLVSVVLASAAWAQIPLAWSAAGLSRGLTPSFDNSTAWVENPAGLAALNLTPQEGKDWAHDASASYISLGGPDATPFSSIDMFRASWSACKPDGAVGVGAGFADVQYLGRFIGAGVGVGIGDTGLSVGLNLLNINPDFPIPDQTLLNGGVMYLINQGADEAPIRLGLTAMDLSDETTIGPFLNAQVWWPVTNRIRIGGEVRDITGEIPGLDTPWSVGGEFDFADGWTLRAGVFDWGIPVLDTQFAGGLCYQFGRYRVEGGVVSPIDGPIIPPGVDMNITWTVGGGISW